MKVISSIKTHETKNLRKGDLLPEEQHKYYGNLDEVVESISFNEKTTIEFLDVGSPFELGDEINHKGLKFVIISKENSTDIYKYKATSI